MSITGSVFKKFYESISCTPNCILKWNNYFQNLEQAYDYLQYDLILETNEAIVTLSPDNKRIIILQASVGNILVFDDKPNQDENGTYTVLYPEYDNLLNENGEKNIAIRSFHVVFNNEKEYKVISKAML